MILEGKLLFCHFSESALNTINIKAANTLSWNRISIMTKNVFAYDLTRSKNNKLLPLR